MRNTMRYTSHLPDANRINQHALQFCALKSVATTSSSTFAYLKQVFLGLPQTILYASKIVYIFIYLWMA